MFKALVALNSFGHELQVKVYVRVVACSLNNFFMPFLVRSSFVHRTPSWPSGDDSTDLSEFQAFVTWSYFFCLESVLANVKFSEFFEYQGE